MESESVQSAAADSASPKDSGGAPARGRHWRRPRRRWLVVGLAVLLLAGGGIGASVLLGGDRASAASAFTTTAQVAKGTQTLSVSLEGTLAPKQQSDVNFTVSGTVTSVLVNAGDTVKKGQKLATVDDSELKVAVELAQANLTSASANLSEVYDNDGSSAEIRAAKAQVTSSRAALASAEEDLAGATLRSPVAGTVASVGVEVGDSVSSSTTSSSSSTSSATSSSSSAAFEVIGTSTWTVQGSIGAADLSSVKVGQKVSVTASGTTESLTGTVASVGTVATSSSSDDSAATFPVVISLSGTHTGLYSGTTVSAAITTGTFDDVLTVPTAALSTEDGKTVVTRVVNGANTTVEVGLGRVFGSNTEITSGLSEGDTVRITIATPSSTSSSSSSGSGIELGGLTGGGPPN